MTLDLWFWAKTREEAEQQAVEWAAAEPNVARSDILEVVNVRAERWSVSVSLTLRDRFTETLGLWS